MYFKDSKAAALEVYWLQTVLDDRAESAPPPAPVEPEAGDEQ
jgi:hypothetical protein